VKTGRKIEKKNNFLPIRSNPTRVTEFKNICKKILKITKTSSRLHFKTKRATTGRKIENKKNFFPIRSNLNRVRKFKNRCKKILKIKKIIQASFQDETGQDRPKNREQKKFLSYPFETDPS